MDQPRRERRTRARAEKELATLKRRHRVAEMYLAGRTQWDIATECGIVQGTVSKDLAALRAMWRERCAADYSAKVDEEVARINRLEAIASAAWERSCKDEESLHAETTSGRAAAVAGVVTRFPDVTKQSKTVRGQAGDPRFLDRIAWCIETRLKLIGALKQVHEHSGKDGTPIVVQLVEEIVGNDRQPDNAAADDKNNSGSAAPGSA